MNLVSRAVLAALLAGGMTTAVVAKDKKAEAAAPGGVDQKNLSKPGRTAILAAQTAQKAGDNAGALAAVRAARTAGGLNETDRFYLAQTELGIGQALSDNTVLEEALKESLATQFLPADQRAAYTRNLGALAYGRKDYAAATAAFEEYIKLRPDDADAILNLSLIYGDYKQNDKAVATLEKAIAAKKAKGEVPPEVWYRQRLKVAFDAKLAAQTNTASVDLVSAYPTPTNWYDAINVFRDAANGDDQFNLDVFRLMHSVNAMGPDREWQEYARLALDKGLPGEAKKILDEGVATKKLTGTKPIEKEISGIANGKVAADKASLPGLEKDAAKAANGKVALGTGDAYFGYGNYAKAAEMYKIAVAKSTGVDAATANLRLGAALAEAGDKAGATAALQAVQGGPRQQLAQYWLIKVNGKTA